jgi:RES domain-containing protein
MLSCWRIVQQRFSSDAFTGEGARLYGGRWNTPGHAVVYAAGSRSLAVLEILAHLDGPQLLSSYVLFEATFPESLATDLAPKTLPPDWREDPAPRSTQSVGDEWLRKATSPVLRVPSVLIPEEQNYLLNPGHPDFQQVHISGPQKFTFDPRWKL